MDGVVYAASHKDRNKVWTWEVLIPCRNIVKKSEHKPKVIGLYMRKESLKILRL